MDGSSISDKLREALDRAYQSGFEAGRISAQQDIEYALDSMAPQSVILDKSINELGLTERARKVLINNNINTISELTQMSEDELLYMNNFGNNSLVDVQNNLARRGLSLKKD